MQLSWIQYLCTVVSSILVYVVFEKCFFKLVPNDSEKLYSNIIAHRGLHMFCPENSISAFVAAKESNMAIELDVRLTGDKEIVCFHDKYTRRLLGIPGKITMFTMEDIKKYTLRDNEERIPTLQQALDAINGDVDILIEIKGRFNKAYLKRLLEVLDGYTGKTYFHTKYITNYLKLKKIFKYDGEKRVYYIPNPFRKRFEFVKGKDYDYQLNKYNELKRNKSIEVPSVGDISSIIVRSIENLEDKKEILATIGKVINKYESRIKMEDKENWVLKSLWLHRAILSDEYMEHSRESFEACVKFAKERNIPVVLEFDVMLYKGEVRCYHYDKISNIFGQSKSCAEKMLIENTLTLKEILGIVSKAQNVSLALDIKDYRIKNRVLEELIISDMESSKFDGKFIVMSYNPMVLTYFKQKRPSWLRAQIGHSLKGLRKVPFFRFPWILNGLLGILFDMASSDCVVFDDSKWIYYLIAYHKNIQGKPVLIYAPKSYMEQEAFIGKRSVANFIVENITDENSWPEEYVNGFKNKEN